MSSAVVTQILNKSKAIIATIGAALTALSVLLPEGTYKTYLATALVIVTGIGTFLAKNTPALTDDPEVAPPTLH